MPCFLLLVSPEPVAAEALAPAALGRRAQASIEWLDALRRDARILYSSVAGRSIDRLAFGEAESTARGSSRGGNDDLCLVVETDAPERVRAHVRRCPHARPGVVELIALESVRSSAPLDALAAGE